jgi:hypothetical protein
LLKNRLILDQGEGYGTMYFISPELDLEYDEFAKIWDRIGRKQIMWGKSIRVREFGFNSRRICILLIRQRSAIAWIDLGLLGWISQD